MAKNIIHQGQGWLQLELPAGIGLVSGDQALIGNALTVDLITDADAVGNATCRIPCPYTVQVDVVGANDGGNAQINPGDAVYKDGADINADAVNGAFYGYALATVAAGATTSILVARAL